MRSSRIRALLLLLFGLAGLPAAGGAEVYLSRKEALAEAFPEADHVEERTVILDEGQVQAVQERAHAELDTKLVTIYEGRRGGTTTGYAFIDVHTVRTLPEAFLVVITPEGAVRSLRMLAFYEPPEYAPLEGWLAQFDRRHLDDELRLGGAIHGIAGATLSSRAVTGGVRRALALFEVLVGGEAPGRGDALAGHGAAGASGGR